MVALNIGLVHYWVDQIYGTVMHRLRLAPPFFSAGWGEAKLELLERLTRQFFFEDLNTQHWPPPPVRPIWTTVWESRTARLQEGIFATPCSPHIRHALPIESHTARVTLLTPRHLPVHQTACILHLAGTGDHGFKRRLRLGGPLLQDGIATMVLESPYYGNRRPMLQHGAKLLCVGDLLLLGRATIEEARAILYWMANDVGFDKLGVCGLSMGGVHAAMVGALHPTPIAVLPLLAPHSAAVAFCEGILKYGTAWEVLMRDETSSNCSSTLEQVQEKMRSILSLTDVTRFPLPKNPSAVIFVAATDDGYIPKHSVMELQKAWPGSEVRWVRGGHVSSFILHNSEFQRAIRDALARL